ncbi:shikimate kinase [Oceanirhabdus sp. W0125-5]|uniref:shikimate kinase n=1 Tax=Oceanirhabdus sp. W0125-5 TaxID=2999116 RepID=UPI0022F34179|nr:deoxynucleoside kinase [Oceanirhabdus sp. W0125-5]WBW96456.1 deoxynucleoside kinase [Oceanirhabdus sp. W0125-5]
MRRDIILIGPVGVGKSTVGKLLSDRLNMPQASLDDKRWSIYEEIGYDFEYADKIYEEEGFLGMYKYWKPFEAHSVKRVLEMYEDHIHDFGAGQSVYEDKNLFEEVSNILKPFSNVVLLLPSPNKEESLKILFKRNEFPHNNLFINNPSNEKLAKIIVYTDGKTPEETCEEIISKLKL